CFRHRLVVEADGSHHDPAEDEVRDAWLRREGFRVLRFSNQQIESRPHEVLMAITEASEAKLVGRNRLGLLDPSSDLARLRRARPPSPARGEGRERPSLSRRTAGPQAPPCPL